MEIEVCYSIPKNYIHIRNLFPAVHFEYEYYKSPCKFILNNKHTPCVDIYIITSDKDNEGNNIEVLYKTIPPKLFKNHDTHRFIMNYNKYTENVKILLLNGSNFTTAQIYIDELYLLRTSMKPNDILLNFDFSNYQEYTIQTHTFNIKEQLYADLNILNKNIINSYLKLELHDYQISNINWMKNIEVNIDKNDSYLYYINYDNYYKLYNNKFYINKYSNICYTCEQLEFDPDGSLNIRGGILSDAVGKGKTATVIGLIIADKYNFKKREKFVIKIKLNKNTSDASNMSNVISTSNIDTSTSNIDTSISKLDSPTSNATIIVCPRKLSEQWKLEFDKFCTNIKIISLNTIHDYNKYNIDDYRTVDVVIVSTSYLINKNYLDSLKSDGSFNIMKMKWKRIIIDEAHEIIKSRKRKDDILVSQYLFDLKVKYKWCITATPFPDYDKSYIEILKFLSPSFRQLQSELDSKSESNLYSNSNPNLYSYTFETFINSYLRKNDTSMIVLPDYIYKNVFIDFTEIEKIIYKNLSTNASNKIFNVEERLKQVCTNIFIDKEESSIINNENASPEEIANKMKLHYINMRKEIEDTYETYKLKERKLIDELKLATEKKDILSIKGKIDRINENYVKLSIEKEKINKSIIAFDRYGDQNSLQDMSSMSSMSSMSPITPITEKTLCTMCNSSIKTYIIQPNGYYFCELCIDFICNGDVYLCPMTGEEIKKSHLKKFTIKPNNSTGTGTGSVSDNQSSVWGSKLEYILKEIKIILSNNNNNKILIFSQWDKMLDIISNMLKFYYINFKKCKGNVYQINKAIREFKTNPTCSILLLSAETSNSGINLPEVSHIILIDTVSHIHSNVIEKQAIGRAVRIGQTKNVEVQRLIINNSIEYDYYKKSIQKEDASASASASAST